MQISETNLPKYSITLIILAQKAKYNSLAGLVSARAIRYPQTHVFLIVTAGKRSEASGTHLEKEKSNNTTLKSHFSLLRTPRILGIR